jgi:DNA-binding IclR family transcriptional regulator
MGKLEVLEALRDARPRMLSNEEIMDTLGYGRSHTSQLLKRLSMDRAVFSMVRGHRKYWGVRET